MDPGHAAAHDRRPTLSCICSLCNMCFGVCACGEPSFKNGVCPNCGSLEPLSGKTVWRAPDHPKCVPVFQRLTPAAWSS